MYKNELISFIISIIKLIFHFIYRSVALINEGLAKLYRPSVTSEDILKQVNSTSESIRKSKKYWTESDNSEMEGNVINKDTLIIFKAFHNLA